ncbi:MAG TPA: imidazoleglycerol-phosphate dehydratase [Methanotrichaceae archaeon]|nr:imidazoleglycerol-phosphate dehydratase [Methanotrichaceae archaeon]
MRKGKSESEVGGARASVELDLEGKGDVDLDSGSGFLDHMLHALARMSEIDLLAKAEGGISPQRSRALGLALGKGLAQALGDKKGLRRYGWAAVPMDEALAQAALDLSGRPYLVMKGEFENEIIGDLASQDVKTILLALAEEARLTLNMKFEGENDHHKAESIFKALGLALKEAKMVEGTEVLSTKGVL